ncbi:MAG: hypothetical protein WC213_00025 [Arenimonas sp.]|jgi:hypothetical protein
MTYRITSPLIAQQLIADTSTTQNHPIGTIVRAKDSTYGEAEFIYLLGVASTAVGSLVTYNGATGVTALAPVGTNKAQPIAVAMSANVASQWGWYQISGIAVMKKTCTVSLAANAAVGVLTIGLVAGTGSGKEIQGALVAAVASATAGRTTVQVVINRPTMQGRVT